MSKVVLNSDPEDFKNGVYVRVDLVPLLMMVRLETLSVSTYNESCCKKILDKDDFLLANDNYREKWCNHLSFGRALGKFALKVDVVFSLKDDFEIKIIVKPPQENMKYLNFPGFVSPFYNQFNFILIHNIKAQFAEIKPEHILKLDWKNHVPDELFFEVTIEPSTVTRQPEYLEERPVSTRAIKKSKSLSGAIKGLFGT
jgi:hypothetical protein